MQQLPLAISPREDATFASFMRLPVNVAVVEALQGLHERDDYSLTVLHGHVGSGRSHLLQAVCLQALESGQDAVFLPLAELRTYPPAELLAGLEAQRVVCLDDVDAVAGLRAWEEQLFNLINRKMACGGALIVAGSRPPSASAFTLPDLVSRLQHGLVLALAEPSDEDKARLFIWRGYLRGMQVPVPVARFVLSHCGRDLHRLMSLLDHMDVQSLKQQRRITLPFVRELLQVEPR